MLTEPQSDVRCGVAAGWCKLERVGQMAHGESGMEKERSAEASSENWAASARADNRGPEYTDFPPGSEELWSLLDTLYASSIRKGWIWAAIMCFKVVAVSVMTACYSPSMGWGVLALCVAFTAGFGCYKCAILATPLKKGLRKAEAYEIAFYARHGFEIENTEK